MVLSLNLIPTERRPALDVAREFDFVGLFLIIAGTVLLLVGFQNADTMSWQSAATIAPIVVGCILLLAGSVNEVYTKKDPVIPPRLFRTRTTACILIVALFHSILFFGASFFIPLYFQILGASATRAGVKQLPFVLGASFVAIGSGGVVSKTGKYRTIIWVGWIIASIGFGLMIMLDEKTSL